MRNQILSLVILSTMCLARTGQSEVIQVSDLPLGAYGFGWSPDSRWITLRSYSSLWKVKSSGGTEILLSTTPDMAFLGVPRWSPDGRWIVLNDFGLVKFPASGGSSEMLGGASHDCPAEWSPDGQWISTACLDEIGRWRLGKVFFQGGPEIILGTHAIPHDNYYFAIATDWSPDGQWIVYQSRDWSTGFTQLYKVRSDNSEEVQLTWDDEDHLEPDWSPDGKWITYRMDSDIHMIPSEGGEEIQVSESYGHLRSPQFSPDGKWIICAWNHGSSGSLLKMEAKEEGTEAWLSWAGQGNVGSPQWSPDGMWIAYHDSVDHQIYKVRSRSPASGWMKMETYMGNPFAGFELFGDLDEGGLAGVGFEGEPRQRACLAHFAETSRWDTGLAMANPDETEAAQATLHFYRDSGVLETEREVTIPANGKASSYVSDFGISGTGWVDVTSDKPLLFMATYQDHVAKDTAALSFQNPETSEWVIPYFREDEQWVTGLSVANVEDHAVTVTLTAYGQDGQVLGDETRIMPARSKIAGRVNDIFGGVMGAGEGWIHVRSQDGNVAGLVVYQGGPGKVAAEGAVVDLDAFEVNLPVVLNDEEWRTGIVITNPGDSEIRIVGRSWPNTEVTGLPEALGPHESASGFVDEWFDLSEIERCVVLLYAVDHKPITGMQFFVHREGRGKETFKGPGLAAILSIEPAFELSMAHYPSSKRWKTAIGAVGYTPSFPWLELYIQSKGDDGTPGEDLNLDFRQPPSFLPLDSLLCLP